MYKVLKNPDFLNDLIICNSKVQVVQTYNSKEVIDSLEDVNGKIVILFFIGEYHTYSWIEHLLCQNKNYYLKTGKLKNYFIILSVHQYQNDLFEEYADFFTVIYEPNLYGYYVDEFEKINIKKNIKYHFLSLNNRACIFRQSLYYFFYKFNLLEKSYFSYIGELERTNYSSYDDILKLLTENNARPWFLKNLDYNFLHQQIPIRIQGDDFYLNDWSIGQPEFYSETFCSVIFETYSDQLFPYFTEKTFKPIAFGHPFIIFGTKDHLKLIQDLGFQTFHDFWDESYDSLTGIHRLEAVFHLILELSTLSVATLEKKYSSMSDIINYNQTHFFGDFYENYRSQSFKKRLTDKIENVVHLKIDML